MAFDREAAKQAGYTDEEINAFLQARQQEARPAAAPTADVTEPPAPSTVITPVETNAGTVATTVGLGVAPYAVPAAVAGAAALGGSKLYTGWKAGTQAAEQLAAAKLASEAGIADREFVRQGVMTADEALARQTAREAALRAGKPIVPTAPTSAAGPVAPAASATPMPAATPTPAAQPNVIQRGTEYVRQLAMNRILPAAGQMIRGGGVTSAALYTPELGPRVPTVGRMRGMEINPLTRRPWTPDQIATYERNPQMFDSQLPPAQMPR